MSKTTRPSHDFNTIEQRPRNEKYEWIHRLISRRSYRISILIVVCVLNVIDLLVDWRFFMIKAITQKVK